MDPRLPPTKGQGVAGVATAAAAEEEAEDRGKDAVGSLINI